MAEIVSDVVTIVEDTGTFFNNRVITYDDDSVHTFKDFVGDDTALLGVYMGKIFQRANEMAETGAKAAAASGKIDEMITWSNDVDTASGENPIENIHTDNTTFLETGGWTVDAVAFEFRVTSGVLEWSLDSVTWDDAYYFIDVIRLHNYPGAAVITDFFKTPLGKYLNLKGDVEILAP